MFENCYTLSNISALSIWNVGNVKRYTRMFYNCQSLTDINVLSKWNVKKGFYFEYMFYGCENLKYAEEISLWKFNKTSESNCMFSNKTLINKEKLIATFGTKSFC